MIHPRRYLIGFLSMMAFSAAAAVTQSDWTLRVWLSEDGLPNNNVAGLTQTPDGYLWMATPVGLARFDGVRFEEFRTGSFTKAHEGERVRMLLSDPNGRLCMGVDPGYIILLDHGVVRAVTNNLPAQTIETMVEDGEGAIWLGCHGGTVCRVRDGSVTTMGPESGWPRGLASAALACDRKGRIWFSKGFETGIFRDGRFKTLMVHENAGTRLAAAADGGMWICAGGHIYKYYEDKKTIDCGRMDAAGPVHGSVSVLLEDRRGGLWIGTAASGLFHYDGSHFETIVTSDREILNLLEDREGNIWVGTGGGGLNRLRPRMVTWQNRDTGAPFEAVQSLCEDSNHVVWAVTSDGAVIRNRQGDWETLSNAVINSTMANCLAVDPAGDVWIGTGEQKLFRWHDGQVTEFGGGSGLVPRVIHGVVPGRDGDLWLCGEAPDSVQSFRDGRFHTVPLPADAHHLRTLSQDHAGNIWAGGDRGALVKIADGKAMAESELTADVKKTVRSIYPASDGSLWIGFSFGGVERLKDGKISRLDVAQGLYVTSVNQMLEDGLGSIWFGSDGGIFRVRTDLLNAVADGRAPTLWSLHYGRSEEMPSLQARYGFAPLALRAHDGRLWFPMRTGLAIVRPERVHEDLQPPAIFVSRANVDDRLTALYGGSMPVGMHVDLARKDSLLRLAPAFHRLEFEFTALSFGPPENIHFKYQLEGFDDHWRDAGNLRSAIYSRLPAGNYSFRVKGCNSDGIWNETGISIPFMVAPFFWQTWWFRLAALFGFTFVVVAIVRYVSFRRLRIQLQVLKQQAALDKERARIARDIHDDLGGSLTQVALLSGLAQRDAQKPARVGEHVQQISAAAQQVIKSLDEIVWAVNPRNDTLPDLINYLGQFAVDFLRTADIQCRAELPDHPPRRPVTSEIRHHLYLVVKETLNNIARHAQASEVRFQVNTTDRAASIVIEDNGRGFRNGEADAFADGVRNMRQRMEEIGGRFQVESVAGQGTRTELNFPLPEMNGSAPT